MKKYLLPIACLLASTTMLAQDEPLPTINVVYNGTTATVTVPDNLTDVSASVKGAHVTITSSTTTEEYAYCLTGQTTNGSLTLDTKCKFELELNGVSIKSQTGAAIHVKSGKRASVSVKKGTENYLEDGVTVDHKAALYFKGHPEFTGSGKLTVMGNYDHAISAKEYLQIKKGNITIKGAKGDGIHCGVGSDDPEKNYFLMNDGTLTIANVQGDCIDSSEFGTMRVEGGTINYTVSANGGRGMKCATNLDVTGGTINATLTGGTSTKTNSKGEIESNRCMALNVGGNMTLTGGNVNVDLQNDEAKSMKVKGDLTISGEGSAIKVVGNHFPVNPSDYQYDMAVYACIKRNGQLLDDYANYQLGGVMNASVCGSAEVLTVQGGYTYCSLRLRSNSTSATTTGFRIYDASKGREFTAPESVTFQSGSTVGTPSHPLILTLNDRGDIDADGDYDLADLALLRSMVLGKTAATEAADLNHDDRVTIADINCLVEMLKDTK